MIKPSTATIAKNSYGDGPRRSRGLDMERRAAILDSAEEVFLKEGYQAASMSAIAAKIGGSKGTLYNYFPSKEDLFLACVSRHCDVLQEQMASLHAETSDVRAALTKLGRRYIEVVSSDDVMRKFRMIVAEAERVPELAQRFYEIGPARGQRTLAEYLEKAMKDGKLRKADPLRAAQHFLGLCYNWLSKARLCNVAPAPDAATIERDVAEAVRVFMAAYAAE